MRVQRAIAAVGSGSCLRGSALVAVLVATGCLAGCQDYPFETRQDLQSHSIDLKEVVSTVKPTDILFMIDNSGSMFDHVNELRANLKVFFSELAKSANDYQVGIVTPDMDCNVPTQNCSPGGTNLACCNNAVSNGLKPCTESKNSSGVYVTSNCDGGRLRAYDNIHRIFHRPDPKKGETVDTLVQNITNTIISLGTNGTAYEAGIEAVRTAIACAMGDSSCPKQDIADLDKGLIRKNTNVVIIFISDEDDCSFRDTSVYNRPVNDSDPGDQATHLCSPNECYAYYAFDQNGVLRPEYDSGQNTMDCAASNICQSGLMTWAARPPTQRRFDCGGVQRTVNPPLPDSVQGYVDDIINLLGGDPLRLRAAAITGSVADSSDSELKSKAAACVFDGNEPSNDCGCWSVTLEPLYCDFTGALGQLSTRIPPSGGGVIGGCQAMAGGRYEQFLRDLDARRTAAGGSGQSLADSICKVDYTQTMENIVDVLFLDNCVDLGQAIDDPNNLRVTYNGKTIQQVRKGSAFPGWSWSASSPDQICLEGGLTKSIGDDLDVFIYEPDAQSTP